MVIFCALVVSLSVESQQASKRENVEKEVRTIGSILKRLNLNPTPSISARVLGVLSNVFPREICPETVDLATIMANEEDEVFCGDVAYTTTIRERARLQNLGVTNTVESHSLQ